MNRWSKTVLMIGLLLAAAGVGRQALAADAWAGTYTYTELIPTLSGVTGAIDHTLTVKAGTGQSTANLKALGYQTNDELVCDTRVVGDRLEILFRSYPDGGTKNQFGVELYKPGAVLMTLEWQGTGAQRKLITKWGAYNTDAPRSKTGDALFEKAG